MFINFVSGLIALPACGLQLCLYVSRSQFVTVSNQTTCLLLFCNKNVKGINFVDSIRITRR